MKKWDKPELKDLLIEKTQEGEVCSTKARIDFGPLIPFCDWRNENGECKSPIYGCEWFSWPCPQASISDPS